MLFFAKLFIMKRKIESATNGYFYYVTDPNKKMVKKFLPVKKPVTNKIKFDDYEN
jgi:hypothetical protein